VNRLLDDKDWDVFISLAVEAKNAQDSFVRNQGPWWMRDHPGAPSGLFICVDYAEEVRRIPHPPIAG